MKWLIALLGCFVLPTTVAADVSLGTGFFITSDGYFATNFHVVKDALSIKIRAHGNQVLQARLITADTVNDLAILKAEGRFQPLSVVNSRSVKAGTQVVTMGFPLVSIQGGEPKITDGIVNSISGAGNDTRLFQISVPLQAGNSGGPLVMRDGNVIGIVTAKLDAIQVLARTGDLPQNVNYSVKSNYLLELLSSIPEIEKQLPQPRQRRLSDLEQLAELVARSIVIVAAERAEKQITAEPAPKPQSAPPEPPKPQSVFSQLPALWKSLQTGNVIRYRYFGDNRVYFEVATPSRAIVTMEGAVSGDRVFGTMRVQWSCVTPMFTRVCPIEFPFELTHVSPTRIEGTSGYFDVIDCGNCSIRNSLRNQFTWIPN